MPQAEIDVDETLVRRLLADLPHRWRDLRDAPVEHLSTGWDNSVWRVGSDGEYANLSLDESRPTDGSGLGLLDHDDLASGDPAVDLRALWLVLDTDQREQARSPRPARGSSSSAASALKASGAYDDPAWTRARGWTAASFVLPVAADPQGRVIFADAIHHALAQLGCQ